MIEQILTMVGVHIFGNLVAYNSVARDCEARCMRRIKKGGHKHSLYTRRARLSYCCRWHDCSRCSDAVPGAATAPTAGRSCCTTARCCRTGCCVVDSRDNEQLLWKGRGLTDCRSHNELSTHHMWDVAYHPLRHKKSLKSHEFGSGPAYRIEARQSCPWAKTLALGFA